MTLLTEDQAKEQVCPFIRFCINQEHVYQDKVPPIYVHQNCMGSACKMAWRWAGYRLVAGGKNDEAHGYCGIAGKPEELTNVR